MQNNEKLNFKGHLGRISTKIQGQIECFDQSVVLNEF